jgi:hypothetical protein
MVRTTAAALMMLVCVSAVPVRAAAGQSDDPSPLYARLLVPPGVAASPAVLLPASRGAALPSLYVSLAALEMYDGYTTMTGVRHGAVEGNPVLGGAAANSPALWAIKGGAAVGVIFIAERLWRQHHRGQAVAVMLASNGIMAAVAARNARVLSTR